MSCLNDPRPQRISLFDLLVLVITLLFREPPHQAAMGRLEELPSHSWAANVLIHLPELCLSTQPKPSSLDMMYINELNKTRHWGHF